MLTKKSEIKITSRRPNLDCTHICTEVPSLEEILPRDQILLKKEKGKLTTAFSPAPHTVVSRKGNSTIIESPQPVPYTHNTILGNKLQTSTTDHVSTRNTIFAGTREARLEVFLVLGYYPLSD